MKIDDDDSDDLSWDHRLIKFYESCGADNQKEDIVKVDLDFDWGVSLLVDDQQNLDKTFRVKFSDENNKLLHEIPLLNNGVLCRPRQQWHVDWNISVDDILENGNYRNLLDYKYNLDNVLVDIICDSGSLGDTIAWVPYIEEFRKRHNCRINLISGWSDMFKKSYPNISHWSYDDTSRLEGEEPFSRMHVGWYYNYENGFHMDIHKNDPRSVPLQQTASDTFGFDYKEIQSRVDIPEGYDRAIEEKYVTLSVHGTAQCKYWNWKGGWNKVVDYLHSLGYKVMSIDKFHTFGGGGVVNTIPSNSIDNTG